MASELSPREIQTRIRAGATVAQLAEESDMEVKRISPFAGPVLAEREHMVRLALAATVRRRGDSVGQRRLGDVIDERLRARGVDADAITWDSWRRGDLKWQLVGTIEDEAAPRFAEFIFDHKGRFSVASNTDARWMIGEEPPGASSPDDENTVDFDDEFALVRATQDPSGSSAGAAGDETLLPDTDHDDVSQTSELDDLYDMMSGISEDSVRIYVGLEDDDEDAAEADSEAKQTDREDESGPEAKQTSHEPEDAAEGQDQGNQAGDAAETTAQDPPGKAADEETATEDSPSQEALVEDPTPKPARQPRKPRRRGRAQVPSWDEIMFGSGD